MENTVNPYLSDVPWVNVLPKTLVVCCSDGRLQKSTDDFLHTQLGIQDYDRLYAPGGPGALSSGGAESPHADAFRHDLSFLTVAHKVQQVVLIFHGTADDGPAGAACAYYKQLMPPDSTPADTAQRQATDADEVVRFVAGITPGLEILVYRAEAQSDNRIQFIPLETPKA